MPACEKKDIIKWVAKGVGIAVLAYMAIVGIIRFTIVYTAEKDGGRPCIQYYIEGVFLILLAALAITNMWEMQKLRPFFKLLQNMRGRGIFMIVLSFWTLEWGISFELACFILMILVGSGFIVFSCVIKEEEAISN